MVLLEYNLKFVFILSVPNLVCSSFDPSEPEGSARSTDTPVRVPRVPLQGFPWNQEGPEGSSIGLSVE